MTTISFRTSTLPWALAHDDEERFPQAVLALLGFVIVFGIALRFITIAEPERTAVTLPPVVAQLLLDKPTRRHRLHRRRKRSRRPSPISRTSPSPPVAHQAPCRASARSWKRASDPGQAAG